MLRRIKLVDGAYTVNEEEADSESNLSTSPSRFNPGESGQQVIFNQQFKQASYQYHLLFQTKTYSAVGELRQVGSIVGAFLKEANTEHYNLAGLIKLSKSLSKCLFGHKFYLFWVPAHKDSRISVLFVTSTNIGESVCQKSILIWYPIFLTYMYYINWSILLIYLNLKPVTVRVLT